MTRELIDQRSALRRQLAAIAGDEPLSSYFELRFKLTRGGMGQDFIPIRESYRAARAILNRSQTTDVYVGAAPRARRAGTGDAVERVWCLWVDCDTTEAVERLRAFRPLPSIVNRSGTGGHLHAWWPLRESILPVHAVRANRRLALALGADRAATDAARIMRAPGTLHHKHQPPTPVECVRLELDSFDVASIVRGLADDPAYLPKPTARRRGRAPADPGPAALAGLTRFVREAPDHQRNIRLNWAAYRAGEHAADGKLDAGVAEGELLAAATETGLPEHEALRTIASGLTAATGRRAA